MNTNVVEIRPRQLELLCSQFVDKYEKDSPRTAALWVKGRFEPHERDRMRELINKEFIERGYEFKI